MTEAASITMHIQGRAHHSAGKHLAILIRPDISWFSGNAVTYRTNYNLYRALQTLASLTGFTAAGSWSEFDTGTSPGGLCEEDCCFDEGTGCSSS